MRFLLTLGTVATAMVVPWGSLSPFLPKAAGSAVEPASVERVSTPAAVLNASLGIMPVEDKAPVESEPDVRMPGVPVVDRQLEQFAASFQGDVPPGKRLQCENGVCKLVDDDAPAAPGDEPVPTATSFDSQGAGNTGTHETPSSWEAARQQLKELGATQLRLETSESGDEFRFTCALPIRPGSRASRRFEAIGPSDLDAVGQVIAQIRAWQNAN